MMNDTEITILVTPTAFDPGDHLRGFGGAGDGAIASFIGQVRGDEDTILTLEHYPGVTEKTLRKIAENATARWNLSRALIIHRIGEMRMGDPIVLTACASAHRRDALEACSFLIDVLKTQAPFWKKEADATGARWIETSTADNDAAHQWMKDAKP